MVTKFTGNGLFLTSDSHFFHSNIIKFCNRPFIDVDEMNQALIDNWNSVVDVEDTVFHLGDFCFGNAQKWKEIRDQLNGHIILIIGNHDWKQMSNGIKDLFDFTAQQMKIVVDNRIVLLNHYPFLCFAHGNPDIYNENDLVWNPFGHVHTCPNYTGSDAVRLNYLYPTQYDVGVDNNNFTTIINVYFKTKKR